MIILIGGISDIIIDLIWFLCGVWWCVYVYCVYFCVDLVILVLFWMFGCFVVFVLVWCEVNVIGFMLYSVLVVIFDYDCYIYVGVYLNDKVISDVVCVIGLLKIWLVIGLCDGLMIKVDNLNLMWCVLCVDEDMKGVWFKVIVFYDVEDLMYSGEYVLFDSLIEWFVFV